MEGDGSLRSGSATPSVMKRSRTGSERTEGTNTGEANREPLLSGQTEIRAGGGQKGRRGPTAPLQVHYRLTRGTQMPRENWGGDLLWWLLQLDGIEDRPGERIRFVQCAQSLGFFFFSLINFMK